MYWIITLTVVIDQFAKNFVRNTMDYGQSIAIIDNYFYLTLYFNSGAAWGVFSGQKGFLSVVGVISIIGFLLYSYNVTEKLTRIAIGLFIGGSIGNLLDRLIFGEVTDMFDVRILNSPIFNMADIFLVCGFILLIISTFKESKIESHLS